MFKNHVLMTCSSLFFENYFKVDLWLYDMKRLTWYDMQSWPKVKDQTCFMTFSLLRHNIPSNIVSVHGLLYYYNGDKLAVFLQ